jgi:beta-glucosidase-like glycosyl hydrolase
MLLICAKTEAVEAGFEAVEKAIQTGEISENRLDESLQRIARYKNLMQSPPTFDPNRLAELSQKIERLNLKLK